MKNIFVQLVVAALLVSSSLSAWSTELKIGAAGKQGEYTNTIVPALDKKLRSHGYSAVAQVSQGSQQNVEDVSSGKLTVALSQWDVAALAMQEGAGEQLTLIGKIAPEALLCAVNVNGRARSLHDFTDPRETPLKVSVGSEKSGTARTFSYLQKLDPRLKGVELIYDEDLEAELHRLTSKARDAVCFVMMPNPDNPLLKLVHESKDLEFIDFVNKKLANAQIGGEHVYDVIEVPVSPGVWGIGAKTVNTLVTWVGMIVNKDQADLRLTVLLKTIASEPDLLPPTSAAGKALLLFDKYKVKAAEAAHDWSEKAGETARDWTEKAKDMMH
jgi:TRAP-type uncharacterized transport system substrate-binding protein